MPTLSWLGKKKIVNHHLDVPFHVLDKKYKFESKVENSNNSADNKIIHGDNLAVLKSLLPEFEGKVDCIYIDPPYNTGNEGWIYNDNVNDPRIKKWLNTVVGKEGEDLSRHDKWLCMIYPRLKLLKQLLHQFGFIFISIDDNEQANLKLICDEIFGENNFRGKISRATGTPSGQGYGILVKEVDYIFVYSKTSIPELKGLAFSKEDEKIYDKEDKYGRYLTRSLRKTGGEDRKEDRPTMYYGITAPDDSVLFPISPTGYDSRWRCSYETYLELIQQNRIEWIANNERGEISWKPYQKFYLEGRLKQPSNLWQGIEGNKKASIDIKNIFNDKVFETPKPIELIKRILEIASDKEAIILDSFAGSATTAHAVLKLNAEDGGNRRFIICEMMDYAETITAERVRRAMDGYGEGKNKTEGLGGSFEYLELGEPLFLGNELLNESVGIERIRQYVSYSERIPLEQQLPIENSISPSALGINEQTLWLFNYDENAVTSLDLDFLGSLNLRELIQRPSQYVIYADKCVLENKFMQDHGITFKRIPRDILRF
ncbi:MAG: site-specific DNA-methyltransferase [Chryseobacterium sp.]|nr:site-specific DNA-methyltransferase [Chryseobacterium sp.]MDN5487646.1 site-specific DNA-methyltransferase [Lactococcus lactis]